MLLRCCDSLDRRSMQTAKHVWSVQASTGVQAVLIHPDPDAISRHPSTGGCGPLPSQSSATALHKPRQFVHLYRRLQCKPCLYARLHSRPDALLTAPGEASRQERDRSTEDHPVQSQIPLFPPLPPARPPRPPTAAGWCCTALVEGVGAPAAVMAQAAERHAGLQQAGVTSCKHGQVAASSTDTAPFSAHTPAGPHVIDKSWNGRGQQGVPSSHDQHPTAIKV
jgi:hypothetical protein